MFSYQIISRKNGKVLGFVAADSRSEALALASELKNVTAVLI
jgi:hypothetical protein